MPHFFQAGGFGMITTTLLGVFAVIYGLKALTEPTSRALVVLRSLPGLLMVQGLIGMATGFWVMAQKFEEVGFVERIASTPTRAAVIGFVGTGETMCNVFYAGIFATVVIVLRILVERKLAPQAA
jgi:hypothetical protein